MSLGCNAAWTQACDKEHAIGQCEWNNEKQIYLSVDQDRCYVNRWGT